MSTMLSRFESIDINSHSRSSRATTILLEHSFLDLLQKMSSKFIINELELSEWHKFPEFIRNDQCFIAFRKKFEQIRGKFPIFSRKRKPRSICQN